MVKDINQIIENLLNFYDFSNKIILSVGAGGGQFIAYGKAAKHVVAIDNDKKALKMLAKNIEKLGLTEKFTLVHSDFSNTNIKGDVVLFEFCLHEMQNPQLMLEHALKTAKDVVIADHNTDSEWAYIGDETEKAIKSWKDVKNNKLTKLGSYDAEQYFKDYNELFEKVKVQGKNSIERIEKFKNCEDITIPMKYDYALLQREDT